MHILGSVLYLPYKICSLNLSPILYEWTRTRDINKAYIERLKTIWSHLLAINYDCP